MVATLDSPEKLSAVEAVNLMLRAYGEARVSELGENADAVKAEKTLIQTVGAVSSEGYEFTTVGSATLLRDVNGEIAIPPNVLQVVPTGRSYYLDVVVQDGRLFDRENSSYAFDDDVTAHLTYALPWDDIPQAAAWYIAYRAALTFVSDEKPGDPALGGLREQLRVAKANLEQFDARLRPGSLREKNPHFNRIRKRRRRSE